MFYKKEPKTDEKYVKNRPCNLKELSMTSQPLKALLASTFI